MKTTMETSRNVSDKGFANLLASLFHGIRYNTACLSEEISKAITRSEEIFDPPSVDSTIPQADDVLNAAGAFVLARNSWRERT